MTTGEHEPRPGRETMGSIAARRLIAELRQPLTAASNYVGTARELILSGEAGKVGLAPDILDKASHQILAAGLIASRLHDCIIAEWPDE